jgi:hypothetical protein
MCNISFTIPLVGGSGVAGATSRGSRRSGVASRAIDNASTSVLDLFGVSTRGLVNALEFLTDSEARTLHAGDLSGITEVGVDAHKVGGNAFSRDILHNNLPRAVLLVIAAVSARAVQLANIHHAEAINCHGARSVVLYDLVLGFLGASASDGSVAGAEDGDGVLGYVSGC